MSTLTDAQYDTLNVEIGTDPLERGYAALGDAALAASLNAADRDVSSGWRVTTDELRRLFGPTRAGAIVRALETIAAIDNANGNDAKYLLIMLLGDGADSSVEAIRDLFTRATPGIFSNNELVAMNAESWTKRSRAAELGLREITVGHVDSARRQLAAGD